MPRQKWDKQLVVSIIKERHANGLPLNSAYINKHYRKLLRAAFRHFGNWQNAIEAAGISYSAVRTDDKAKKHFGTRKLVKKWNKETVKEELLKLHAEGVSLNYRFLRRSKKYSYIYSAGRKVFGTWYAALEAVGMSHLIIRKRNSPGWWTKSRIIEYLVLLERMKIRLSMKSMQKSYPALVTAASDKFGGWGQALEAAGISYRQHSLVWSTRAWLKRMSTVEYQSVLGSAKIHARKRRRA